MGTRRVTGAVKSATLRSVRTAAVALAVALVGLPAVAQEPHPLRLVVGGTLAICKTGTILCPAGAAVCDDTTVAAFEAGPDGLALRALKPGTTLCSAASASGAGPRRVYRVTVEAAPASPPAQGG